ncbi:MAG: hypothetical protein ACPHK8_02705 [Thermoplasmatota archaeon]
MKKQPPKEIRWAWFASSPFHFLWLVALGAAVGYGYFWFFIFLLGRLVFDEFVWFIIQSPSLALGGAICLTAIISAITWSAATQRWQKTWYQTEPNVQGSNVHSDYQTASIEKADIQFIHVFQSMSQASIDTGKLRLCGENKGIWLDGVSEPVALARELLSLPDGKNKQRYEGEYLRYEWRIMAFVLLPWSALCIVDDLTLPFSYAPYVEWGKYMLLLAIGLLAPIRVAKWTVSIQDGYCCIKLPRRSIVVPTRFVHSIRRKKNKLRVRWMEGNRQKCITLTKLQARR